MDIFLIDDKVEKLLKKFSCAKIWNSKFWLLYFTFILCSTTFNFKIGAFSNVNDLRKTFGTHRTQNWNLWNLQIFRIFLDFWSSETFFYETHKFSLHIFKNICIYRKLHKNFDRNNCSISYIFNSVNKEKISKILKQ